MFKMDKKCESCNRAINIPKAIPIIAARAVVPTEKDNPFSIYLYLSPPIKYLLVVLNTPSVPP